MLYILLSCSNQLCHKLSQLHNFASANEPVFLLNAVLMIPNIVIRPSLEDTQEALVIAGKNITGVAKGVAQWTGGKPIKVTPPHPLPHPATTNISVSVFTFRCIFNNFTNYICSNVALMVDYVFTVLYFEIFF